MSDYVTIKKWFYDPRNKPFPKEVRISESEVITDVEKFVFTTIKRIDAQQDNILFAGEFDRLVSLFKILTYEKERK